MDPIRATRRADAPVYAVRGGHHVTILLTGEETGGALDAIQVVAQPGGGPQPHSHAFAEWLQVLEGELRLAEEIDGELMLTASLRAGDCAWVPPWAVHATVNQTETAVRFNVVGSPAALAGYVIEAGVPVADTQTPPAVDLPWPVDLEEVAARYEIRYWTPPGL